LKTLEYKYEEKPILNERKYTGNIIGVDLMTVITPNGEKATRDVVIHPGASAIIPLDNEGNIYLVKQYRTPVGKLFLELPAGKLDANEDPLECAKRELLEETGLYSDDFTHITSIHTTPGFCNEVIHIYLATNLKKSNACLDEGEFLTCDKYKISDLSDMISNQLITDAKTIIGIYIAEKIFNNKV
jgi:ADP-ribose pyrophosphatase